MAFLYVPLERSGDRWTEPRRDIRAVASGVPRGPCRCVCLRTGSTPRSGRVYSRMFAGDTSGVTEDAADRIGERPARRIRGRTPVSVG